jgi:hypothetical protein
MKLQTKINKITNEVDLFNEQHDSYQEITTRPSKLARKLATEVIEEQSEFIHFTLETDEWEIVYHQHSNGKWSACFQQYITEE